MTSEPKPKRCLGWGPLEGVCPNPAGSTHSPLWCQKCDDKRREHLSRQFAKITGAFRAR